MVWHAGFISSSFNYITDDVELLIENGSFLAIPVYKTQCAFAHFGIQT